MWLLIKLIFFTLLNPFSFSARIDKARHKAIYQFFSNAVIDTLDKIDNFRILKC